MLGHKLAQEWRDMFDVYGTLRGGFGEFGRFGVIDRARVVEHVDVTDDIAVRNAVETIAPDVIFNAAGVIKQLPSSKNTVTALTVNSVFPHRLAEIAASLGARLVTVSTDCVFKGDRGMYRESDEPDAADLYGLSKRLGEVDAPGCLTLRTSIIGPELLTRHSLLEWFLSNEGGAVRGFRGAIYSGFPTVALARVIARILTEHRDLSGLYHVSSEPIDKFMLLSQIKAAYGARIGIEPDDDFRIDRSLDSTRFRDATGFQPPDWPELVATMAADDLAHGQKRR